MSASLNFAASPRLPSSVVILGLVSLLPRSYRGPCSDWLGRRKPLLVTGYTISAVIKTILPLAESAASVLVVRAADRVAKGLRDAPRDALFADITPRSIQGAGFGLRAALYTLGFVIGPLAANTLEGIGS